ncbi:thiopurine S-methyltransferase [Sphaerotilus hippei]|uniref:Thiopurine S-methyltransferase n=1 Tax=Sphaerotilus hippei TaxID=744406 RepID=A0A318GUV6_9BURK|nr:methyltransferase domain-containing protein [Sphaerotilus hippei]PXW92362.1 thiopurine S-methyltransferase [Sphaerotilus hippei]
MAGPTLDFWQQRFEAGDLPWDRGEPGPQLAVWQQAGLLAPGVRVAVPGCGSGHEVLALAQAGCHVTAIDYAPGALALTRQRLEAAGLPASAVTLVQADVLAWQPDEPVDVIYEQTCWCALHPDHWSAYAARLAHWLRPGGTLALLAMQALREGAREGRVEGPPYHLDVHMLRALLPASGWDWPAPPHVPVPHPNGRWFELAITLQRR